MADKISKEARSWNMSRIKNSNTKPELLVRKFLYGKGLRYRINVMGLPGKPDILLKKYRTVVFVNGCFWHHHKNCKDATMPKSNTEFWENKILQNVERDSRNYKLLSESNWNVIVVWECELTQKNRQTVLDSLYHRIVSQLSL